MRSFKPTKKYTQIAIYAGATIAAAILFGVILFNLGTVGDLIASLVSVLSPLLYGLMIAYLTRPLVVRFERLFVKLLKRDTRKTEKTRARADTFARALSILSSFVLLGGIVFCFVTFVFPLFLCRAILLTTSISSGVSFTISHFSGASPFSCRNFFCASVGFFPFFTFPPP